MKISTVIDGGEKAERIFLLLPAILDREISGALRKMGNVVARRARQLVPPPGYPGDKPDKKPLRDTIGVEIKYGRQRYAVIGPMRPAGAHGHLVEFSHRYFAWGVDTGRMTEPHPFMGPAAQETIPRQNAIAAEAIRKMDAEINRVR